jgi:PAS domain S-box-containing protein
MLRRRLTLPAAAIALALGLALTGVGFWAGHTTVSVVSNHLIRHVVDDVDRDVGAMMHRPQRVLSRVAADIARHATPLDDPRAVLRELYGVLADEPDIDWLFFANQAGGDVSVGRLADDVKVFLMTDGFRPGVMRQYEASPDGQLGQLRRSSAAFDARQKPWYRQAAETRARYWTEPYLGYSEPVLGITLSAPIVDEDGGFAGVIGTDVILTQLSREMQTLSLGDKGRAFIIDSTGQLIASSGGVMPVAVSADGGELRVLASDADDPVVRGTARYLRTQPDIPGQLPGTGLQAFSFDDPALGESYAAVKSFQAPGGVSWTVVAAIPASDFLGPARYALLLSIAMSVLIVALALGLGSWTVRRALRPLTALTEAARSIARGEWRDVPEVQRNDEIGLLARAFKLMTSSLKDTEDDLRRSEENYRSIFENALEGIIRTSRDGRLLAANPASARMSGYTSPEDMIAELGNSREQLWANPRARDAALSTLLRDGAISGYETEFYRKDGRRIWVLLSSRMVRDTSGEPIYAESFVTDISERKRAEEALDHARAELARVARVTTLGELTASIAHEVNQPLTAVATNASTCLVWLAGNPPDVKEARQAAERIVKDSHRASAVIQRIRALVEKSPQRKDWLSVNDVIREVVTLTRSEADRNRVSLETELDDDLPPVRGDGIQLQQVILNLIMNAIEAMSAVGEGPRELLVRSARDGSQAVLVAVRDSGKGLDPEQLDQVFDAFYTTKPTGMGMGLAISRSIVEAHGGRLWATANTPQGAIFQFTLLAEDEEGSAPGQTTFSSREK